MAATLDFELTGVKEVNCNLENEIIKMRSFLTQANQEKTAKADKIIAAFPDAMLECARDVEGRVAIENLAKYQNKDGYRIAQIASWNSMAYNVINCAKAAGVVVKCKHKSFLYELGALNIDVVTKWMTDFPDVFV
ncbi:unnamed protein product [Owenia fusiformis]|uniref:Uncharacterized protein n=1 Tax=Owenia fusiformis TaxID=6347 RepID=A0A8S4PGE5_OWEFU|nr:unnamed protein product [Owenia fusiformis]